MFPYEASAEESSEADTRVEADAQCAEADTQAADEAESENATPVLARCPDSWLAC